MYFPLRWHKSLFAMFVIVISIYAQNNWNWVNPNLQGNHLQSIIHNGSEFYSVGWHGTIVTSTDGENWTSVSSGTKECLYSIASGNDLLVAVGFNGVILNSQDGTSWSKVSSGIDSKLNSIVFGNGKFVAVGENGVILTSDNGTNWSSVSTNTEYEFLGVSYTNNRFVAVGQAGIIHMSEDGISWDIQDAGLWTYLYDVAYGNGCYVAVGYNHYNSFAAVMRSVDGVNWDFMITPIKKYLFAIEFNNNTFTFAGEEGIVYTSSDGIEWTYRNSETIRTLFSMVSVGEDIYCAGLAGMISYLPKEGDGRAITMGIANPVYDFATNGSSIICVGGNSYSRTVIKIENNEIPFDTTFKSTPCLKAIAYGNDKYVAVGDYGTIGTSVDGESWVDQSSGTNLSLLDIIYDGSKFLAVGDYGSILLSSDGETWTSGTSGVTKLLNSIASNNNGKYVCVGEGGLILSSSDGETWEVQAERMIASSLNKVKFVNGHFMAVGVNGTIIKSDNGVDWSFVKTDYKMTLNSIEYAGDQYIITGTSGTLLTSNDGVNWSKNDAACDYNLLSIIKVNNYTFIGGDFGTIIMSELGENPISHFNENQSKSKYFSIEPLNNILKIKANDLMNDKNFNISIFSVSGRKILSRSVKGSGETEISTKAFSSGSYVMSVKTMGGINFKHRFIVTK